MARATGGKRLALVIGNRAYEWKPLTNPVNDARAVARVLTGLGFEVTPKFDARRDDLRRSVREFVESVRPGDLAFLYYSGHGVEVRGENYLLPVDLPSDATEGYVQDEAVSAQRVLRDLGDQGARVKVLILDACRDNPLRGAKSAGGGLAPMEGKGSLVVFATEAGRTASDSPGAANGLFTQYLLRGLEMPGMSLDDAMKRVSRNVAKATGERQVPAIYGLLLEDVILNPGRAPANPAPPRPVEQATAKRGPGTRLNPKDGLTYVWIAPGSFVMGCTPAFACPATEMPAHNVTISKGFWIGQTEVTQAAWERVMGDNPSVEKGADLPVENVTWSQAETYCVKIGGILPYEAQWEFAARAGISYGRYLGPERIAWYQRNSGDKSHPAAQKEPNAWGLYDVLGNVAEWTAGYDVYHANAQVDPKGPSLSEKQAVRGGHFGAPVDDISLSKREATITTTHSREVGFRCASER